MNLLAINTTATTALDNSNETRVLIPINLHSVYKSNPKAIQLMLAWIKDNIKVNQMHFILSNVIHDTSNTINTIAKDIIQFTEFVTGQKAHPEYNDEAIEKNSTLLLTRIGESLKSYGASYETLLGKGNSIKSVILNQLEKTKPQLIILFKDADETVTTEKVLHSVLNSSEWESFLYPVFIIVPLATLAG